MSPQCAPATRPLPCSRQHPCCPLTLLLVLVLLEGQQQHINVCALVHLVQVLRRHRCDVKVLPGRCEELRLRLRIASTKRRLMCPKQNCLSSCASRPLRAHRFQDAYELVPLQSMWQSAEAAKLACSRLQPHAALPTWRLRPWEM